LLNGCEPRFDTGEAQAHFALDVVELAVQAAEHFLR
jgi:hypothetical protein